MDKNFTRLFKIFGAFCLLSFTTTLWAQTVSEWVVGPTRTVDIREFAKSLQWEPATDAPSRSPLRVADPAPDDIRWIDRIHNLPSYLLTFYNNHHKAVQDALNGKTNYLVDYKSGTQQETDLWEDYYMIPIKTWSYKIEYTFPDDVDYTDVNAKREYALLAVENAIDKHFEELDNFMPYTFMSMSYDNPEAFWLGNFYTWCGCWNYRFNYINEKGHDYVQYMYYTYFIIKGTVNDNPFDYRIVPFTTATQIKEGITEFKTLVDGILEDLPNSTRYVQLRYLNDWLTKHNAYAANYDPNTSPSIVWSPMSALRGTTGTAGPVCEAYSRALKVLLNRINIPCVLAVGDAKWDVSVTPESHMWNEVKMNDGNWYAVDVTWNDPMTGAANELKQSGAENEDWLLLGRNDIVAPGLTFAQSHPNSLAFGQSSSSHWDYDNETLIADTRFDVSTYGVHQAAMTAGSVKVYSLLGVNIGTFESLDQAISSLESGLYIINGRKVVVK